jgi:phage-related protein
LIRYGDPPALGLELQAGGYAGAVYVLHAFQKKSKVGRKTPRRDIELVKQRLREAEQIAKERES